MDDEKKVLIVDDEIKIIEVIKALLESKDFIVFIAENAKDAFNIFEKENISLIILDLMLPDMSGEEICSIIRKKSRIPIIMLTAKIDEEDKIKGLGIGADDYMTKPFSLKELYARVEAVLRRSEDYIKPLYEIGYFRDHDLVIDFQSHVVKKKNLEVNLTANEFKILATLIKYPNKVFTRSELIVSALGNGFEGYDRIIDSHIKNIRQKIEDNPKESVYLLTVHGVGYKFGGD
ncbi:response regulator transcription factor [Clostridium vincentii]|uniref:Stage 0 sporulation protein A homolog n=1 Tax=Clostridium vincentii TaxID=52704 RepID=A0A2T0BCZ2_9CLOT|nr:response regulator transcription factor [Clostridium vincentii]PRR81715.1 Alkaline phosphatase synthesis transcriptional regulatory protein SphR [Clostridium vincentii]